LFYEKKRRDIVNLQTLNEFVKPNPYFLYYMFKDTIHVDDYGSIKETLFKFPTLNKVSIIKYLRSIYRMDNKIIPKFFCSAMMSTRRFRLATM